MINWFSEHNLELNVNKRKQIIVDFKRKKSTPLAPPLIDGRSVEIVHNFKFHGSVISNNLKLELHIDIIVKNAQQRL